MARIHGKHGQVLMDPTATAPPVSPDAIADISDFTLDLSTQRVEVTAFGDTNIRRVTGLPDYAGTLGGFWNSATSPALFTVILSGVPAWLRLMPDSLEPTYFFEGLANIDGGIKVSATGAVTFSGKWDAADNWTMAPTGTTGRDGRDGRDAHDGRAQA
jgi:hypothetical protein